MEPNYKHHRTNNCPNCGKKKDYRSALCIECGRKTNSGFKSELLTPEWCYAFTGIFMGEGSIGIHYDKRSGGSYHVRAQIKLRADDFELMNDIHNRLGGTLYNEKARGNSKPIITWATTDTGQVNGLCDLLLSHNILPAKKMRDVSIVKEFCTWRMSQPYRGFDWKYGADLQDKLLSCREFK